MHNLTIDGDNFAIPHSWNELTPDQFIRIASLGIQNLPFAEFRAKALLRLLDLRVMKRKPVMVDDVPHYYLKHGHSRIYLLSVEALDEVAGTISFLISEKIVKNQKYYFINPKLTRNLIPEVNGLVGPADGLVNCIFEEFIRAQTSLEKFHKTGKTEHLDMLIAALYRPRDPEADVSSADYKGDIREAFNDYTIDVRMKAVSKLSPEIKNAILMFYQGCFYMIDKKFPHVFNGDGSGAVNADPYMGFMKLANALAQNDVTKAEQVRRSMLYDVLVTLEELAIQKEKLDAIKPKK
jgi:hypothetical protein